MPRPIEHNVILPLNIATNEKFAERAKSIIEQSQKLYDYLVKEKYFLNRFGELEKLSKRLLIEELFMFNWRPASEAEIHSSIYSPSKE